MPQQEKKYLVLLIYFALAISTLLVFWQVRNFDFINYDDNDYVSGNPHVVNGLTLDDVWWAFTASRSANWHPLTWLSLMLDCQLFGTNAGEMHLVNVLLHLVNTLLFFTVLKKMTGALWPSAFVAAAFAIHPMHVQSVVWIAERKDVLSTLFWLLAMLMYVRYAQKPNAARYLLVLLMFALGLMAKPMLVTLPFVFLLLDYWPLERISHFSRQIVYSLILEKIPFFVLSVISSIVTFLAQRSGGAVIDIDVLSLNDRIANVFLSYARYIGKMFWPQNLALLYPFTSPSILPFWQASICALLLLLIISFFVFRYGRSRKYLSVGWLWFLGTLIPVIGIVQVGRQAYADRYTYIPYIGLFIMIAWGLSSFLSKRKIVLSVSMAIVLTTLGICAHRQTSYWKNNITLFSHTIEKTQNNYLMHNNLGVAYDTLGRYHEAMDAYKEAIKIRPNYATAHYNLGVVYTNLSRWSEAIDAYKEAIKIKPDYTEAYHNLGLAYGNIGRYEEAIDALKQAIKIKPDYANTYYDLGLAYGGIGNHQGEIEAYGQAVKINSNYAEAYNNLGITYCGLGRYEEAIDALKQAIRIKPDFTNAHLALGFAYLSSGDKHSAMEEYEILKTLNAQMADNLLNRINK